MSDQIAIEMTREQWVLISKALRQFGSEYGADYWLGWEDEVEAVDTLESLIFSATHEI